MRKAFVSLIAILALAVSAFAADLPHSRHVADTGSAYELALPAGASVIVTAPAAWLEASRLMLRSDQLLTSTSAQRATDRDIYATKNDYGAANRPRAVTRVWRC